MPVITFYEHARDNGRCEAVVHRRDTYRVARGSRGKFKMHYNRCQCSRKQVAGYLLCAQHLAMFERWDGERDRVKVQQPA